MTPLTWYCRLISGRDVYRVVGEANDGSPPWVLEIDVLLVTQMGQGTDAGKQLFELCQHAANAGMAPQEFAAILRHRIAHEHSQRQYQQQVLANQLGQHQGYGSQQQMNQQQAMYQNQYNNQQQGLHPFGFNNNAAGLQAALLGQGIGGFAQQAPSPPPSPLWDKPQKIETEMLAYRGWKLDLEYCGLDDDDRVVCAIVLRSMSKTSLWLGPVFRADQVPAATNSYGVYAVGTDDRHLGNFNAYAAAAPVWGEVSLSGLVVEGANGYRAEVCTIRRLWLHPAVSAHFLAGVVPPEALARALANRYQVDTPTVRQPVFTWVQELERHRKDCDAMFTQAKGTFPP